MGPRKLPQFQDYKSGKCELEEGTISIDVEKNEVFVTNGTGKKINVGTSFSYIVQ